VVNIARFMKEDARGKAHPAALLTSFWMLSKYSAIAWLPAFQTEVSRPDDIQPNASIVQARPGKGTLSSLAVVHLNKQTAVCRECNLICTWTASHAHCNS